MRFILFFLVFSCAFTGNYSLAQRGSLGTSIHNQMIRNGQAQLDRDRAEREAKRARKAAADAADAAYKRQLYQEKLAREARERELNAKRAAAAKEEALRRELAAANALRAENEARLQREHEENLLKLRLEAQAREKEEAEILAAAETSRAKSATIPRPVQYYSLTSKRDRKAAKRKTLGL